MSPLEDVNLPPSEPGLPLGFPNFTTLVNIQPVDFSWLDPVNFS